MTEEQARALDEDTIVRMLLTSPPWVRVQYLADEHRGGWAYDHPDVHCDPRAYVIPCSAARCSNRILVDGTCESHAHARRRFCSAACRTWDDYHRHPERSTAYQRSYYSRHREARRAYQRAYWALYKDEINRARRVKRKKGTPTP